MRKFAPKTSILPPEQLRLWPELAGAKALGFVLYGGTAVALRLGHRKSVDFDFFSSRPLDRDALMQALPIAGGSTTLQDERNALTLLTPAGVKLSFFGAIGIGRIGEPEISNDGVILVASLEDLLAAKVKVILQRAEAKDYHDIAEMLRHGADLARALAAAQVMYGPAFHPRESLKAMVFFEDGDLKTLTKQNRETLIAAVRKTGELPAIELRSRDLGIVP